MEGDHSNGFDSGAAALKTRLTPWRELVLLSQRLLTWEKPFFPGVIAGATTLVYLILYCLDLSNLTLFPLLAALALIADAAVPMIAPKVFDPSKWTNQQERDFEDICDVLAKGKRHLTNTCTSVCEARDKSPKLFTVCALGVLLILSWLGSILNGFFAAWLVTLLALLAPGLKKNGVLDKVIHLIMSKAKMN